MSTIASSSLPKLNGKQTALWRTLVTSMGFNPDELATPQTRTATTSSIREFLSWIAPIPAPSSQKSALSGTDLTNLTQEQAQQALDQHLLGTAPLTDDAELNAVEKQLQPFNYEVTAAGPDPTDITSANPLILQGNYVLNDVVLSDGGYIRFAQSATFTCTSFTRVPDNTTSTYGYDIVILGAAGVAGKAGTTGVNYTNGQPAAANGKNGNCNGCSARNGGNGSDGVTGNPGGDSNFNTSQDGGDAPQSTLSLGVLTGGVTLINTGGNGGVGGAGGTGGQGQNGGNGGHAKSCCSGAHSKAGNGGNGGNGGQGGNGANGGNGGNGAYVSVSFDTVNSTGTILATKGVAAGGGGGAVGAGGAGGAGGGSGGNEGHNGAPGNQGAAGNVAGIMGIAGLPGRVVVNGADV